MGKNRGLDRGVNCGDFGWCGWLIDGAWMMEVVVGCEEYQ